MYYVCNAVKLVRMSWQVHRLADVAELTNKGEQAGPELTHEGLRDLCIVIEPTYRMLDVGRALRAWPAVMVRSL